MPTLANFRQRVRHLKAETHALYYAARHPDTPWYAKLFIAGIVAYALSPIDLIPDFIPILGLLDDLILVPLGIVIALKMIPPKVLESCRARAHSTDTKGRVAGRVTAGVIVGIWVVAAGLVGWWVYEGLVGY